MKIKRQLKTKGILAINQSVGLVAALTIAILFLSFSPTVVADSIDRQPATSESSGVYLEAVNKTGTIGTNSKSLYPSIVNDIAVLATNMPSISEIRTDEHRVTRELYVQASAYTSRVEETDSTPFITASNTQVRHGVLAANFLPFGTKVLIPDYYGNDIFTVEDRMNKRYPNNVDIWFADLKDARQFGRRTIRVQILES